MQPRPSHRLTPTSLPLAAFRRSFARIEELFAAYGDHCEFANIYISEAHPSDGWSFGADHPEQQDWLGAKTAEAKAAYNKWDVKQPTTTAERLKIARDWVADISPASPYYCDPIDDNTRFAFEAVPERLYIVADGKIAYRGGEGPFGYKTDEVARWLAAKFPEVTAPPPKQKAPAKNSYCNTGTIACVGAVAVAAAAYFAAEQR